MIGGEKRKAAAAPPLINGMRCAPVAGVVPRGGYGAAPPASRVLRIALRAAALRAAPDPGDLGGPFGRKQGQAGPAPSRCAARRVTMTARLLAMSSVMTGWNYGRKRTFE